MVYLLCGQNSTHVTSLAAEEYSGATEPVRDRIMVVRTAQNLSKSPETATSTTVQVCICTACS